MKKNLVLPFLCICLAAVSTIVFPVRSDCAVSNENKTIILPAPDTKGGKPLMEALSLRQSDRNIDVKPLGKQELSNLLWATWGVNRSDGRRTAPYGQKQPENRSLRGLGKRSMAL